MTITPQDRLSSLLSTIHPPAFIHLHHPHTPSTSLNAPSLPKNPQGGSSRYAQVDLIELSTPKLLYSAILHRLSSAGNHGGPTGVASSSKGAASEREVSTWDELAIGLRAALRVVPEPSQAEAEAEAQGAVVMITHAERLQSVLGARWAVITRIRELTGLPITVITASQQTWDHLRPFAADAPEPIHVYLPALTRTELLSVLAPRSAIWHGSATNGDGPVEGDANPFMTGFGSSTGSVHPLWPHFCNLLLATFAHLAPTSAEMSYIAEPLWTIYTAKLPAHSEQTLLRPESTGRGEPASSSAPPLDITVKLLTDLKYAISPAFAVASEALLSGSIGRFTFLSSLLPATDAAGQQDLDNPLLGPSKRALPRAPSLEVPYIAKFLLIASYLASQNPPRTDLRLFGRGLTADGSRKKGGGTRRAGYGRVKVGKVPQRLVGPKPFALERGLAIWSALYAENGKRPADLEPEAESSDESDDTGDEDEDEDEDEDAAPITPSKRKVGPNGMGDDDLPVSSAKPKRLREEDWLYSRAERESRRADRKRKRAVEMEERWEEYVNEMSMSVALWGLIPDLESQGLVKRVSPSERLDNIQMRCEIGYEAATGLAKEVGIILDEYLYEAQA